MVSVGIDGGSVVVEHSSPAPVVPQRHLPPTHDVPGPHTVPHAPQFIGSVARSEHVVAHAVRPPGQLHAPLVQAAVGGHFLVHWPQCNGSLARSKHPSSHTFFAQ
jgi:hypothetical protein